ncbi:helix-turn-helix domain-containing protein [Nocardioides sp. YIM 152588]|uniref:PucR family transcriptional regulator n=1 Tax=Nocardioides sp. YIM 152588 TaxID=3158259 RepID=UPI0032E38055
MERGPVRVEAPDEATRAAATALVQRCVGGVNALARELTDRWFVDIPAYDQLPAELKETEFADTARHATRQLLLAVGGEPIEILPLMRARAAQRATEGIPLRLMVDAYLFGSQYVWRAIAREARPEEQAALPWIAEVQMRLVGEAVSAVVDSYQAQVTAGRAEQDEGRQALARALVDGAGVAEAAASAEAVLAPAYLVAQVRRVDGDEATVAARRAREFLRADLFRRLGSGVLTLRESEGLVLLLPQAEGTDVEGELRGAVRQVGGLAVGTAPAPEPHRVPEAAERARLISSIAVSTDRGAGVFGLGEVLLEYHLAGGPGAADALVELVRPLVERPDLLETASAFIDQQMERGRTARALHVHGNTVDNRLARIRELSGIDLRTAEGVVLMTAALLARRLRPQA